MANQFTWIPIYQELAIELAKWQDRQGKLIAFLENLREQQYVITPLTDKEAEGSRFLLKEIDPFTFYGVFNRGIRYENRLAILDNIKKFFNLKSPLPDDFDGIPILNNQKSWFFPYQESRDVGDIPKLWNVFRQALRNDPLTSKEFIKAFDAALTVQQTNVNLTMGLFWIRPDTFLNLDHTNRTFLKIKLPPSGLTAAFYIDTLRKITLKEISFPILSHKAWSALKNHPQKSGEILPPEAPARGEINYWMVGAYWDSMDPADQTERFIAEGIWENGYTDRYLEEVKSMRVGDRIAIKATATQRNDLPFDNRNKTISLMIIKAIGTIVANRNDGITIEVEWDPDFKEKNWYFYTNRGTVWHVGPIDKNVWREAADKLINFAWYNQTQDYDWFIAQWWGSNPLQEIEKSEDRSEVVRTPYSPEDMRASGAFLEEAEINQIIDSLADKKAMIIQGPPGVGKTFIARNLAYVLMKEIDRKRLEFIQFHQSYSYDDFVRGYRPLAGKAGTFGLQNGVFYDFCQKALKDPEREYVFIIDEINRGNLSQIFGELLMLIENDKRGPEFSVPLVYRTQDEPRFYVPPNLYLIGLMNLADRSLAMVDYALRRRFAFYTLEPKFEGAIYKKWLSDRSMSAPLIKTITDRMSELNKLIREDPLLGENYQVGHSYFCPKGDNFEALGDSWYRSKVITEVIPLLKEYWFDNPQKIEEAERILLA